MGGVGGEGVGGGGGLGGGGVGGGGGGPQGWGLGGSWDKTSTVISTLNWGYKK